MGKSNKSSAKAQNVASPSSGSVSTDSRTFLIVLFYCVLIIFSPIVSFFGFKLFLFDEWTTPVRSNIYSAVVAVVSLHIALGLYLFRATTGQSTDSKVQKED